MTRDWNLVRDILLAIEEQAQGITLQQVGLPAKYSDQATVLGHLRLLFQAGFIDGQMKPMGAHMFFAIKGLTWAGHDFLDSIRNDTVWQKTQEQAAKIGGSVALDTLKAIATAAAASLLGLGPG